MGNIFSTLWETARVSAVEATHLFASKRLLMMCQQQNTKSHGIRRYRTVSTEHRKYDQLPQVQADAPKNANDTIPKQTLTMLENDLNMNASNSISNWACREHHTLEWWFFGMFWQMEQQMKHHFFLHSKEKWSNASTKNGAQNIQIRVAEK